MSAPSTWRPTRVDRVATVHGRIGWKALTASEYQPEGYAFLATPNIKLESIDFENVNYISRHRYDESPELKLELEDVLLAKDGNTLGITNIVRELPRPATVNGSIAVLRAFDIEPRFLRYVLASTPLQQLIDAIKGGMGVPHLFQWDIRRLPLTAPTIDEQRRIADFLDTETVRVDTLLAARAAQVRCLTQLWESRLANQVEFLIASYGVAPLRRITRCIEQGWSPQCDDSVADRDEWAVLKTSAVSSGEFDPLQHKRLPQLLNVDHRYRVFDGDLLLTRGSGSPRHVGVAAIARTDGRKLLLSDLLYRVRLERDWSPKLAAWLLLSKPIRGSMALFFRGQSGQTIKLRADDIRSIEIPAVPSGQQEAVAAHFESDYSDIRASIEAIEVSSSLLNERRQALITAAVTGQIDVTTARGISGGGGG